MKSLISIGGRAPERLPFTPDYDKIVAADSGYDTALRLGLTPSVFVGDGDSTERREELEKKGVKFASVKKDESDFTLALREVEGDYDLIGGGEGRLDHTIGIFSTFVTERAPRLWMTHEDALFSGTRFDIEVPVDTLLSFFPVDLSEKVSVSTSGLEWNVVEREISLAFFSLSNRTAAKKVHIEASAPIFARFPLSLLAESIIVKTC